MIKSISDLNYVEGIKKQFISENVPWGSTIPNLVLLSQDEGERYSSEVIADQDLEITLADYLEHTFTIYSGLNVKGFKTASRIIAQNRDSSYRGIVDKLNAELLETKPF